MNARPARACGCGLAVTLVARSSVRVLERGRAELPDRQLLDGECQYVAVRAESSRSNAQGRISKTNRGFGSTASERPAWGQMTGWIDAARNVSSITTLGSRSGGGRSWALIPPAWRGGDR